MKKILVATNSQKTIDFLIKNPGEEYLSREIQKATKISKAGTNFALRDLVKAGLVKRQKRGKVYLYSIDFYHPVIKQLKVLRVVVSLTPLLKKIKRESRKVLLYGSSSRGEDIKESDIDLFVVTNSSQVVEELIKASSLSKKIQLTTRTPLKYVEMEKTDPTFYREVEQGIVLWDAENEF